MTLPLEMALFVAAAGLGGIARWQLGLRLHGAEGFPWGIVSANLIGSFVAGLVSGHLGSTTEPIFAVALLGGFTTFSTFANDTVAMSLRARAQAAALVTSTVLGGIGLAALGTQLT